MPTTRFWPEITTGRCLDRSLCSAGMTTTNDLLLIANAGDGTISALRLHREPDPHLEVLATSADLPGCSTFAIDPDHDPSAMIATFVDLVATILNPIDQPAATAPESEPSEALV